jgi:ElaA protein
MADLGTADLYAALAARQQVFAVEQRCAFLDADGHDAHAWHLLGWAGEPREQRLVAYLRVLDPGHKFARAVDRSRAHPCAVSWRSVWVAY